jgi:hypothetical protein
MALITAVAVALSIRRDSLFIALLGLIGGFATPALLSTGEDRPIGLFGYLLLLNAGLAWVARKRRWKILPVLSLAFTVVYQWGWAIKFLDAARLPLAAGIFLLFPLLAFAVPLFDRRRSGEGRETDEGYEEHARRSPPDLGPPPVHRPPRRRAAYGARYASSFGFLLLLDLPRDRRRPRAAVAARAGRRGVPPRRLARCPYRTEARPSVLAWVSVFVLLYLAAGSRPAWAGRSWGGPSAPGPPLFPRLPGLLVLEARLGADVRCPVGSSPPPPRRGPTTGGAALTFPPPSSLMAEGRLVGPYLTEARLLSGVSLRPRSLPGRAALAPPLPAQAPARGAAPCLSPEPRPPSSWPRGRGSEWPRGRALLPAVLQPRARRRGRPPWLSSPVRPPRGS